MKSNGVLCGRINVRGFKQVEGQHYDNTTISLPVTNAATIRIVLTLMVMSGMIAHVVNVKGAFLHGDFENGKNIHMKIPRGDLRREAFSGKERDPIEEMPLWNGAGRESILEKAITGSTSDGTVAKPCRPLPLLQMGCGMASNDDVTD